MSEKEKVFVVKLLDNTILFMAEEVQVVAKNADEAEAKALEMKPWYFEVQSVREQ